MNNPFYEAISTPLRSHRRPPVSERGRGSEEVREVERERKERRTRREWTSEGERMRRRRVRVKGKSDHNVRSSREEEQKI